MNLNPYESPQAVEDRQDAIEAPPPSSWLPKITVVVMALSAVLFEMIPSHRPPRSLLQRCFVIGQLVGIPVSILTAAMKMQFVMDRIGEVFRRSQ
jgi:hypothetical protein